MFSFLRPAHPPKTNQASDNPIYFDGGRAKFHPPSVRSHKYVMTHTVPPTDPKTGPSVLQPPFHLHLWQSEHFKVLSGTANFYMGLDKKPISTVSAETGSKVITTIPAKRYHRYENASTTEDLVVDVQLNEEDYAMEQKFFRNFIGYIDDCNKHKTAPSIFQLMVFLRSAGIPLALPLPFEGLGVIVSWIFMEVMAAWGSWILGYRDSYVEYYESSKSK